MFINNQFNKEKKTARESETNSRLIKHETKTKYV